MTGGYYFIFYSGNGFTSPNYAIGVGRSSNITGPYEKVDVGSCFLFFLFLF